MPVEESKSGLLGLTQVLAGESMWRTLDRNEFCINFGGLETFVHPDGLSEQDVLIFGPVNQQ
jgi:hypothetical protein